MKKIYILLGTLLFSFLSYSQGYQFGIVHVTGYNFKIVAIPNFNSSTYNPGTGNTDISDVGFTLVLPAGNVDATNPVGLLGGRTWSIQQDNAALLTLFGLGDGTKDVFQFNLPPGQTILSHTAGQQIDLVSFDITNSPITGSMYILLNTDPIAIGASNVLDSFYNTDLDAPGGNPTADYFSGLAPGMDSFIFSVLAVDQNEIVNANIKIYPNPATDILNINSSVEIKNVEMFDLLGKRVIATKQTNQIEVSQLPVGVYFLKAHTENGTITKKVVIE